MVICWIIYIYVLLLVKSLSSCVIRWQTSRPKGPVWVGWPHHRQKVTMSPQREKKALRSPASCTRSQSRTVARMGSTRAPTGEMLRVMLRRSSEQDVETVWVQLWFAVGFLKSVTAEGQQQFTWHMQLFQDHNDRWILKSCFICLLSSEILLVFSCFLSFACVSGVELSATLQDLRPATDYHVRFVSVLIF